MSDRQPAELPAWWLLIVVLWLAAFSLGVMYWGSNGILLLVAVSVHWCLLSSSRNPRWAPLNHRPMTLTELLVLVAICLILWGLLQPAVEMHGRRRLPSPALSPTVIEPVAAQAPATAELERAD